MITRMIMTVLAVVCLICPATASLTPRKDPLGSWKNQFIKNFPQQFLKDFPQGFVKESSAGKANGGFRITEDTAVELDGRPCNYEEVPNDAAIILLEAVSDRNKEILRIHFRSKK